MDRRSALLGLLAVGTPGHVWAQSNLRPKVVGFVGFATAEADQGTVTAFREALRVLGHQEGRTILVDARSSGGDIERGHALIAEMAALPVDVFLSPGPAASRA